MRLLAGAIVILAGAVLFSAGMFAVLIVAMNGAKDGPGDAAWWAGVVVMLAGVAIVGYDYYLNPPRPGDRA